METVELTMPGLDTAIALAVIRVIAPDLDHDKIAFLLRLKPTELDAFQEREDVQQVLSRVARVRLFLDTKTRQAALSIITQEVLAALLELAATGSFKKINPYSLLQLSKSLMDLLQREVKAQDLEKPSDLEDALQEFPAAKALTLKDKRTTLAIVHGVRKQLAHGSQRIKKDRPK